MSTESIKAAAIAAALVGTAVYVSHTQSAYTAGFIAAAPIALISVMYAPKDKAGEMSRTVSLGLMAYTVFALLFYALVAQNGWDRRKALIVAMGAWAVVTGIMWIVAR